MNDVSMADAGSEREKLIFEAYIPPDPGPYPQDQPKQNSIQIYAHTDWSNQYRM